MLIYNRNPRGYLYLYVKTVTGLSVVGIFAIMIVIMFTVIGPLTDIFTEGSIAMREIYVMVSSLNTTLIQKDISDTAYYVKEIAEKIP